MLEAPRLTPEDLKKYESIFSGYSATSIRQDDRARGKKVIPAKTLYSRHSPVLHMENVQVQGPSGKMEPVERWESAMGRQHPLLAAIGDAPDAIFALSEEIREAWFDARRDVARLKRLSDLHASNPCPFCEQPGLHQSCADALAILRDRAEYPIGPSWCNWGEDEIARAFAEIGLDAPALGVL